MKILKSYVSASLLLCARNYREHEKKAPDISMTDQMLLYINEHLESVTLKDLSCQFQLNPNYISNLLAKQGCNFMSYVEKLKMERAAMLLKKSSLAADEIGMMLGYTDRSNFYRFFKRYFGRTPGQFRTIQELPESETMNTNKSY